LAGALLKGSEPADEKVGAGASYEAAAGAYAGADEAAGADPRFLGS